MTDLTKYEPTVIEGELVTEEEEAEIKKRNERSDYLHSHKEYMENVARRRQSMAMDMDRQAQALHDRAQIQAQAFARPGSLASLGGLQQGLGGLGLDGLVQGTAQQEPLSTEHYEDWKNKEEAIREIEVRIDAEKSNEFNKMIHLIKVSIVFLTTFTVTTIALYKIF